ncbi:cystatin-1-like [Ornithodoros turicata]|uniref:cystatin-1-like n=1 Tax=Ornithodoros turicata TaxID=34597 RepID=UPI003139E796
MIRFTVVILALVTVCVVSKPGPRPFLGGWRDVDPKSDPKYLELAHFAVGSQTEGLEYYNTVVEVTKASEQLVAGINYRLTLKVAPSLCKVAETKYNRESCQPKPDAETKECVTKIYDVPWENKTEVTSFSC